MNNQSTRRGRVPLVLLIAAVTATSTVMSGPGERPASAQETTQPSIVLIVTDDQRPETLAGMPTVTAELIDKGTTFSRAFAVSPLCCPARTSLLTGLYSHSTGVWRNTGPRGGFTAFDDRATLATSLDAAGYDTALVGKYLGDYELEDGTYVPPGWDRWYAFAGEPRYKDFALSIDGNVVNFGKGFYSTDTFAAEAAHFIRSSDDPIFLMFNPNAPHRPAKPAPRHVGTFSELAPHRPPDFNESDVSDKPQWVRERALFEDTRIANIDRFRRRQHESLLAVDEAVARILQELEDTGRLSNTLILYTTDNSLHWGEHRWNGKQTPYEESIKIPYVMRYDPLGVGGGVIDDLVLNIDFAPTVTKLVSSSGLGPFDGRNLLPLVTGSAQWWRREFLIEHAGRYPVPLYCGLRTSKKKYVLHTTGEEELYKLNHDPFELNNLAADPAFESVRLRMRERTLDRCRPRPPGFRVVRHDDSTSTD